MGELPPTQRGVTKRNNKNYSNAMAASNRLVSKNLGDNNILLFFIIFESKLTVFVFNKYNNRFHGGTPGI